MKFLIFILGLVGLGAGVPQRFAPREGRQNSYLAPAASSPASSAASSPPSNYGAAADAAASDEPVAAPSDAYGAASEDYADAPADNYGAASEDSAVDAPVDNYGASSEDVGAEAPGDNYGAASEDQPETAYDEYDANDVPSDQAAPPAAYSPAPPASDDGEDMGLKMLMSSVPGTPGEDYPILSSVVETSFSCDGQVEGGYYADPEAQCQVFHTCAANGQGGLAKYSFLCPNGTIFNQNYFICDWWFNFDCAEAAALAVTKNTELAAARAAVDNAAAASEDAASYVPSSGAASKAAPAAAPSSSAATYTEAPSPAKKSAAPSKKAAAPAKTPAAPAKSAAANTGYGAPEEAADELAGYGRL